MQPAPRTQERRRDGATSARRFLAAYRNQFRPEQTDDHAQERIVSLLEAEAEIHRLLALESSGALGSVYATAHTVQQQHAAAKAGEARAKANQVVAR